MNNEQLENRNNQNQQTTKQVFISFEEQLERAAKMNKVFFVGPVGSSSQDTLEIITPNLSMISMNRLSVMGWQIVHIETTDDGHKLSILIERKTRRGEV